MFVREFRLPFGLNEVGMIRTVYFRCELPRAMAEALNAESGRIYSEVLVEHYRVWRKKGVWLSRNADERMHDAYNARQPRLLQAHSIDAAQQGFAKACQTTRAARKAGATQTRMPYKRKWYRTTIWKASGISTKDGHLLLSLARGRDPLEVSLIKPLLELPAEAFLEVRLVYNQASRHHEWHVVVDNGIEAKPVENGSIAAGDLGEIHPITLTDGKAAAVISCRQLRAQSQHSNKVLAQMQAKQARKVRGSRRWRRLQTRKRRFLAKQERRRRDIEHKVSRAAVDWCVEQGVGTLALGDVRDVADGKRLGKKSQQKISNWSHGKLRQYITYKAEAAGIAVQDKVNEAYTSQTCAGCGKRSKPHGRVYTCSACGSVVHRDVQGAANILSRYVYGALARVPVPPAKYRHPVLRGKRSSPGHGASSSREREATPL
jgi:putative transposase